VLDGDETIARLQLGIAQSDILAVAVEAMFESVRR